MRLKLLDLAIRGQLTKQDACDGRAEDLLRKIHKNKSRMLSRGEIKPKDVRGDTIIYRSEDGLHYERTYDGKAKPVCIEEKIPFEIPEGWSWARMSMLYSFSNGTSKRHGKDGSETIVLRLADLGQEDVSFSNTRSVALTPDEIAKYSLSKSDLLLVRVNGSRERVGSCYVFPGFRQPVAYCDHLIRGRALTDVISEYIRFYVNSSQARKTIDAGIVCAAGQNTVNQGVLGGLLVPIPPLAEQRRIVYELTRSLKYVDTIEREKKGLQQNARQLQLKLIDLAIRGQLTKQDACDGRAEDLLCRIHEEKLDMLSRHEIRNRDVKSDTLIYRDNNGFHYERTYDGKDKPVSIEEKIPFEIPDGWAWVRMGSLVSKLGSGSTPRGGSKIYVDSGVPFIRSQNVYDDGLRLDDVAHITQETNEAKSGSIVKPGDLLLNITGGSIGRCAIVPSDFTEANVNQHVMIVRTTGSLSRRFLHMVIMSDYIQRQIQMRQLGSGRGGLSAEVFGTFLIPIPPLAEQRRIVQRFEAYADILKTLQQYE